MIVKTNYTIIKTYFINKYSLNNIPTIIHLKKIIIEVYGIVGIIGLRKYFFYYMMMTWLENNFDFYLRLVSSDSTF